MMHSEIAKAELLERYAKAIDPDDVRGLARVQGLSGIFAGSVHPSYFESPRKVMVVGREPRGWDEGKRGGTRRKGLMEAPADGDLTAYLSAMMKMHEDTVCRPPADSKFFHFYRKVQAQVAGSSAAGSVAWGNLLCLSHRKGSPVSGLKKSQDADLRKICEWSRALLRIQIEVLRPKIIFFVTSPSYDRYLKTFIDIDKDGRKVHVPEELWQFTAHGAHAFRTRHPRVLRSSKHRKDALKLAMATVSSPAAKQDAA